MAMGMHDHEQVFQDLLEWIENELRISYDITEATATTSRERFIPIGRVGDHFKKDRWEVARRLLRAVFPEQDPPVRPQDVAQRCCRVFCILARIGQTRFIESFVHYPNLWDDRLPFNDGVPPPHFPVDPNRPNFFNRFYEEQWKFFAPKLHNMLGVRFEQPSILPIIQLDQAGGGSSSTVYRAVIHEKHDKIRPETSHTHCYAIKTYKRRRARRDYEKEAAAFNRITEAGTRQTPGIIGFYGSFEYRGSFNLLLEFADKGTLESFFDRQRPSGIVNILAFWKALFEVIKGVWWIHDHHLPISGSDEAQLQQGWHQDLKPANILVLSSDADASYHGVTFKIADFGLSHFKTIMEGGDEAFGLDAAGTSTYGAPECYGKSNYTQFLRHNLVKRGVDIWSLGCIFSETATWVAKGNAGLRQYRDERAAATGRIPHFRGGDCFHNGQSRLRFIDDHHLKLRQDLDGDDCMTGRVLEIMVLEMLREKPNSRPTAEQLDGKAEETVENASAWVPKAVVTPQDDFVESPRVSLGPSPPLPFQTSNGQSLAHSPQGSSVLGGARFYDKSPAGTFDLQDTTSAFQIPSPPITPTRQPTKPSITHERSLSEHLSQGLMLGDRGIAGPTQPHVKEEQFVDPPPKSLQSISPTSSSHGPVGRLSPPQVNNALLPCPLGCGMHMPPGFLEQHKVRCEDDIKRRGQYMEVPNQTRGAAVIAGSSREVIPDETGTKVPYCTVQEVKDYHEARKRNHSTAKLLPNQDLIRQLEDRDHVFMIDDSETMDKHWKEVQVLAMLLTYLVKETDKDGVDLLFLSSPKRYNCKTSRKIYELINDHKVRTLTNLNDRLNDDFAEYSRMIEKPPKRPTGFRSRGSSASSRQGPKKRSIYVFTDGVLRTGEETQGHYAVKTIVQTLLRTGGAKGQLGVQFISFGDDVTGLRRLKNLDLLDLELDIVDTEPSNANVWKMLLGSINPVFDDDPEREIQTVHPVR